MAQKGEKLSEYIKAKIRKNHARFWKGKQKPLSKETIEKIRIANIGKKRSFEIRKKLSDVHKGMIPGNKGKKSSIYGEKHWAWKGGVTSRNSMIRESLEYKLWRKSVFERDNYHCIFGGKKHGSKLEADHIKPFSLFPEFIQRE